MKRTCRNLLLLTLAMVVMLPARMAAAEPWQAVIRDHLKYFGHRNWIVIADSAYPVQANPGIETIVADANQTEVLRFTLAHLQEARNVRPVIYTDKELAFVPEGDAPGVSQYRRDLSGLFGEQPVTTLPHADVIAQLEQTAQNFRVLIIKTNMAIPYTSVFIELRAAYWGDEPEKRLRDAMANAPGK